MTGNVNDLQGMLKRVESRRRHYPCDMIDRNHVDGVVYFGDESELRASFDKS